MSNQLCACDAGIGNMGLSRCDKIFRAAKKFAFVPLYTNAGIENYIDPAVTLDNTWIQALINNDDKSVRLFFTPELKNVKMPKDAPVMESFEDGSNYFISEAVRKVTAELPECPPRWKAKFESIRCVSGVGVYAVDQHGNLIGTKKYGYDFLYPIPINSKSAYAGVMMAEDQTSQKIGVQFEIPNTFDDSTMVMISANAFSGFNMLNIAGLIDSSIAFSGIANGVVTATITTPGSDQFEKIPVEGLVAADFVSSVTGATSTFRDTTTPADIAITTVTESAPGVYDFTFTLAAGKVCVMAIDFDGVDTTNIPLSSFTSA